MIVRPTTVIFQIVIIPAFQIKRWICHNIVKIESLMLVIGKRRIVGCAEIVADAAQREIHLSQTICSGVFLLTINIDAYTAEQNHLDRRN